MIVLVVRVVLIVLVPVVFLLDSNQVAANESFGLPHATTAGKIVLPGVEAGAREQKFSPLQVKLVVTCCG